MEEWKEYKLGEISTMKYGKLPPSLQGSKFPIWSGYRYVGMTDICNCTKGTLIVVARGVGGTGDVKIAKEDCYLTNLSISVIIDSHICNPYFLYYKYLPKNLKYLDSGSAQSQITIDALRKLSIELPPLDYQNFVVDVLKTFDDKIEMNRRINDNLEQQAQALFKSWFVDFEPFKDGEFVESELGMIPKGWRTLCLRDIVEVSKKSVNPSKYPDTIFIHYSIPAFDNGMKPELQLGKDILSNKFTIMNKMTLFSKLNPRIKRVWYIDDVKDNSICSTEFVPYRAKDVLFSSYVFSLINSNGFYDYVMSLVNGATGSHQRFHPDETLSYLIPFNNEVVLNYSKIVEPILKTILKNRAESSRLSSLRDTLLPRLMSGELKINDISV